MNIRGGWLCHYIVANPPYSSGYRSATLLLVLHAVVVSHQRTEIPGVQFLDNIHWENDFVIGFADVYMDL